MDRAALLDISSGVNLTDARVFRLASWIRWLGTSLGRGTYCVASRCRSLLVPLRCVPAEEVAVSCGSEEDLSSRTPDQTQMRKAGRARRRLRRGRGRHLAGPGFCDRVR